ncbi:MAG: hypothetical protein ABEI52_11505 [Halobacteriaceae archaeon]
MSERSGKHDESDFWESVGVYCRPIDERANHISTASIVPLMARTSDRDGANRRGAFYRRNPGDSR